MKRYLFLIATALLAVTLISPAVAQTLQSLKSGSATAKLPDFAEADVPDPERVYRLSVMTIDDHTVQLHVDIDDCCYLYRDRTKIQLVTTDGKPAPAAARIGNYTLPAGKVKTDAFVGKTEIYRTSFEVNVPLDATSVKRSELALKINYQGCVEKPVSVCYAPMTKVLALEGVRAPAVTTSFGTTFWFSLLAAFGAGLLLSFTPCVLPMIPILSGVIIDVEGKNITKWRGGLLSYTYVLGTAVTYAIAGAIAGATGEQLQSYFQNMWAIGIFSIMLVLLALSMFGLYTLQVPSFLQSLLHRHSSNLHRRAKRWVAGEFVGVFLLGLVSALIIGACVSPVLMSALGGAVAARDLLLGAGVMFALAHGQGVILIAIGISEGAFLPKAGAWMNTVKHVFGVLLLAVAIYLLGFLPQVPVLLLWAILLIVCAVYLGATRRLPQGASGWQYLWKGIGTVFLIWGIVALLGSFAGNRDILNPLPLSFLRETTVESATTESTFERITTINALKQRLAQASKAGKPVLLDYYADWCTDCIRMQKSTFADPVVRAELANRFVSLQADVTRADDPETVALKNHFGIYGPPATLFISSSGKEMRELRTYGYIERETFLTMLRRVN